MFILLHYHNIHIYIAKRKLITYINSTLTHVCHSHLFYSTFTYPYTKIAPAESKHTYIIHCLITIVKLVGSFVTFYHMYFSNKSVSLIRVRHEAHKHKRTV